MAFPVTMTATRFAMMRRCWLALVGLGLATCLAMSAQAALRAISDHPGSGVSVEVPDARAMGYEAQDHFPGAALLYDADDMAPVKAAPATGVTGTTELPALPVSAAAADAAALSEVGVVAAQPFRMGRISAIDRARALECLTAAIYYEAASEPDAGQQAVAQVILNRVRHPAFPASVCGVVYQGSERAGCQFSFACDGAMRRVPSRSGWQRATRIAAAALAGYVFAPVGLATHYHTYAVTPAWNRSLVMTDAVGAHFFHRWKGYWGTSMAFHQAYAGTEPMPGPHMPGATLQPASVAIVPAAAPVTAPANIREVYAASGTPVVPPTRSAPDTLPGDSQILDKWKDSGKPLD